LCPPGLSLHPSAAALLVARRSSRSVNVRCTSISSVSTLSRPASANWICVRYPETFCWQLYIPKRFHNGPSVQTISSDRSPQPAPSRRSPGRPQLRAELSRICRLAWHNTLAICSRPPPSSRCGDRRRGHRRAAKAPPFQQHGCRPSAPLKPPRLRSAA
jgi:hypothetical protein